MLAECELISESSMTQQLANDVLKLPQPIKNAFSDGTASSDNSREAVLGTWKESDMQRPDAWSDSAKAR